ncbi:hypothetical protein E4Z66_00600 [Aliishimia ponticola]|uniref:histidine kinase n=1 Tax=Aliishimia ponticola TaxID=2499833 RepID=A0A4S4NPG0_9RHOB|nr:ATP-binding protein [Aliishimia ponticola]THH38110.1 hypothetical protein E4Z66_00600 [Aliishimia ponticola]
MSGISFPPREIIRELQRSESASSFEFIARTGLVVSTILIGWMLFGLNFLILWVAAYYGAVVLEKLAIDHLARQPSRARFYLVVAAGFLVASAFATLPVYLWSFEDPVWKLASAVLLAGASVNVILLRARTWQTAVAYLLPIIFSFLAIAFQVAEPSWSDPHFIGGLVLATAICMYFCIAVREAQNASERLINTQTQLMRAQKVEALSTLTGGISHDFMNVLSVIQGNLELLAEAPDDRERTTFIKDALRATRRGADLTAQLNLYARRATLSPGPVDPIDVVDDVESLVRHVLPPNISFETQKPSDMGDIIIDESALKAALINLIVNARDAIPASGRISLETYRVSPHEGRAGRQPGKPMVVFEVSDTGTGIDPAVMPKVFDPFYTTKPAGQGTGLGLATVLGFARHSGGDVAVESQPGRGTRVRLQLLA